MRGVVALRFLPDLDLVVTMLALAKAGLAYLPLAPEWPQGRLELLLGEVRYIWSGQRIQVNHILSSLWIVDCNFDPI